MKFSIITCTFNSEKFISNNLNSVESQTYCNYEHIIIDNVSTDKTLDIIQVKKAINKRIRIFSAKDKGIYNAFNKGVSKSLGEYIIFLNSDDKFYCSQTLLKINQFLEKNKYPLGLYGNLHYHKNNNLYRKWENDKYLKKLKFGWTPPHPTLILKKEIYSMIKFNENYRISGDYDFIIKVFRKYATKIFYFNTTLVIMEIGGISSNSKFWIKKFQEDLQVLRENNFNFSLLIIILKKLRKLKQLINF